jgi:twitching motility protein PilT
LAAAVRLLPNAAPSLAALEMPVPLQGLVDFPHGLVLVCGATGSGKSTTLAALAQHALSRGPILLITLEDPIEYALEPWRDSLVRRRQVGRDVRDFASGLRDALREDPNVLVVGELRDEETIHMALTAAETGHLVLGSLHSGSVASAIERIVDAYPSERKAQIRVQLADSLRAVVAQRLLPRARGAGRIPAVEILRVTHAVANLVREGRTAQIATSLQSGRREGMMAMERCLADYVQAGLVRMVDARAAANDPESFDLCLAR